MERIDPSENNFSKIEMKMGEYKKKHQMHSLEN